MPLSEPGRIRFVESKIRWLEDRVERMPKGRDRQTLARELESARARLADLLDRDGAS